MAEKKPAVTSNPLMSKNIPPPPLVEPPQSKAATPIEENKGITVSGDNGKMAEVSTNPAPQMVQNERATVEISLYLRASQDDRLEDLRRDYKRRTGKKISANEVVRRLIERATVESLL